MLKNNFIKIPTKGCRKLPYFKSLGYDITGEFIDVNINHLNTGSRQLINVICDYCNKEVEITYREYYRNISVGNKYACSKICGSDKAKETNIKNIGVISHMQLKETQEKTKLTNLEKYGVEFLQQSEIFKEKSKQTLLKKYRVEHISKSEEIRLKTSKISSDVNYINYIKDNTSLFKCDNNFDHTFEIKNDNYYTRKKSNIPICTICNPIGDSSSIKESEFYKFIKSIYSKDIIRNFKDKLEIDIYLPDIKLGFEFNGLYWHSEEYLDKNYHKMKSEFFKAKGIRIIHIWEDDWLNKSEILKSQISNLLGVTDNRIYGRKCHVSEVDNKISKEFLNKNHIQGYVSNKYSIGLFYNGELVSLMTFDKSEGRFKMSKNGWNLSRFCSLINYSVIGGFSKLLKFFISKKNPDRIITYADISWSCGDIYLKNNFKISSIIKPDYKYNVKGLRRNKQGFQKKSLKKMGFDISKSESEIMSENNIYKIWDCGKIKFEINS